MTSLDPILNPIQECRICFELNAKVIGCHCIGVYEHPLCVYNTLLYNHRFQNGRVICTVCRLPTLYVISDMKLYEGAVKQGTFVGEFPRQLLDTAQTSLPLPAERRLLRKNLTLILFFQIANYIGNCMVITLYWNMKSFNLQIDCSLFSSTQVILAITLWLSVSLEVYNFVNVSYPVHPYLFFKYVILTLLYLTFPVSYASRVYYRVSDHDKCIQTLCIISIGTLLGLLLYSVGIYQSIKRESQGQHTHQRLPL
jgi:hypothetical protein